MEFVVIMFSITKVSHRTRYIFSLTRHADATESVINPSLTPFAECVPNTKDPTTCVASDGSYTTHPPFSHTDLRRREEGVAKELPGGK